MILKGELDAVLGYNYEIDGNTMHEYHCDDHITFQRQCNTLPHGGNLLVRKDPLQTPLLIFGQDGCIFKQYVFSQGQWVLPNGTKQLIPKDEGQGVMLSSFVSRELGYGFEIGAVAMEFINK